MNDIAVIGSLNIDLVVRVTHFPAPGETIIGGELMSIPGGKGANQAAAVGKLGKSVTMIGRVGNDNYGKQLLRGLASNGVDTSGITEDPYHSTGSAFIMVDDKGENSIVVSPGANNNVSNFDIDNNIDLIKKTKIVVLQFEIPLDTVYYTTHLAKQLGKKVIINPAPYRSVSKKFLKDIDLMVMNETEATSLLKKPVYDIESAITALKNTSTIGITNAIITLGSNGCVVSDRKEIVHIPALNVTPVDTTAAGDAFIGGLVAALIDDLPLFEAAQFGNICGALTVTKIGAQISLPTMSDVQKKFNNLRVI